MNYDLNNIFAQQASKLKTELYAFNEAAEFKRHALDYYRDIKRLLNKARPNLSINISDLPSDNGSQWRLNISQTQIEDNKVVFKTGQVKGRSVRDVFGAVLEKIETAQPRPSLQMLPRAGLRFD